jgi:hypothetical protein
LSASASKHSEVGGPRPFCEKLSHVAIIQSTGDLAQFLRRPLQSLFPRCGVALKAHEGIGVGLNALSHLENA